MDYSISLHNSTTSSFPPFLPSAVKSQGTHQSFTFTHRRSLPSSPVSVRTYRTRDQVRSGVVACAGASHCEFGSLNSPLEPRSASGKYLSGVLQNQRPLFLLAVSDELKQLADERKGALCRVFRTHDSDLACLYRRIAQVKAHDCDLAIEDIIYMLIIYKFSEIRVPLVPKLSKCIYNGRLEIWPSKDWELESIHCFEVLEMVREHISTVIGLRADSSVTDNWATTEIRHIDLGRVYAASILYGYFLKSASLRHRLEQFLGLPLTDKDNNLGQMPSFQFPEIKARLKNLVGCVGNKQFDSVGQESRRQESNVDTFRHYVMRFDPETLKMCAKLRTKEAAHLIEKHSCALFGNEKTGKLETDGLILTSFSSLKRLVLEAVAFGSFLWDIEEYVNNVYNLKDS
ncbi:hypothetical protein SLEP1_g42465 [Rubroshorea leprosula]|uniref:UV-B-induced protein At3g17800, chloroplastic-like n=2 Tax=Rubroshorea leprosula TaxID=152421 RepID=A0AAV5L9Z3_9ROSI|nr:hypothetical protein SLEP1_g42465 [Rubroshorea leprosula]